MQFITMHAGKDYFSKDCWNPKIKLGQGSTVYVTMHFSENRATKILKDFKIINV